MTAKRSEFPKDETERERRKNLSDHQIADLELAGGVEGGMQAGSAGGPNASESRGEPGAQDGGARGRSKGSRQPRRG